MKGCDVAKRPSRPVRTVRNVLQVVPATHASSLTISPPAGMVPPRTFPENRTRWPVVRDARRLTLGRTRRASSGST